ncbi:MAG: hypothetical protein JWS10_3734 [Cypionkella sp.]|uniref:hypothetical protein n=1 Tax=Cypionkella sp. TaxID=2811411 RepID=UPI00263180BE|nr:hypothetical protein [Cypionkella sp.]MDB5661119.1 hypothetical protein [Cypionkella sp.]
MTHNNPENPGSTVDDSARNQLPPDTQPIFDDSDEDLSWPEHDTLPIDDDGNVLPGDGGAGDDPTDSGEQQQFDPDNTRRRLHLGMPLAE